MWIAQLDRLPTRVRLASWGMHVPTTCCLCSRFDETREHLFLHCEYSRDIWRSAQIRLHLTPTVFASWSSLTVWTMTNAERSPKLLRKLVTQAILYNIWKQRNNLIHNLHSIPAATIFRETDRLVRNTITAGRHKRHFGNLMALWLC